MTITGDNPITNLQDDSLGRTAVARSIAAEIRSVDASEGSVMAILGPWGSGKTSLVNLIRAELESEPKLPVVDFNPWMFSGAEQLVDFFFGEIGAGLRLKDDKLGTIASEIEAYGELFAPLSLLPVAGPWFGRIRGAASTVRKIHEHRKGGVAARRKELGDELRKLDRCIVVVIDDIDRLQTNEIRDIFKLVRLTASFPNVIYLLAFDRERVESALTEKGIQGRSYLEKIVQIAIDIPAIPEGVLANQVGRAIAGSMGDEEYIPFDEKRWLDTLAEIIMPLVKNMRDVRRFAASARGSLHSLNGQVEFVDVIGMEAIRVFMPDVFAIIAAKPEAFTTSRSYGIESHSTKRAIDAALDKAEGQQEVIRSAVRQLFPAASRHIGESDYGSSWNTTWLKARRVAHIDVLRLYLERTVNRKMAAFGDAERAFLLLGDEEKFREFIEAISIERLEDVIAALEAFEEDYPSEGVIGAAAVLLNALPTLPRRQTGFLGVDTRFIVARVVLRLLRRLDAADVDAGMRDLEAKLTSFYSRFQLLPLIVRGTDEANSALLVSRDTAQDFQDRLMHDIRTAPLNAVSEERDAFALVNWAYGQAPETMVVSDTGDTKFNSIMLRGARAEVRSQSLTSRTVQRSYQLDWESLVGIYGSEERLTEAIANVREQVDIDDVLEDALNLASRYLDGWRPSGLLE